MDIMKLVLLNVHLVILNVILVNNMKSVGTVLESELTHLTVFVLINTMKKVLIVLLVVIDVKFVNNTLITVPFVSKTESIHQPVTVQLDSMMMIKIQLVQNVVVTVQPVTILHLTV
jgi:hypothetical protein